MPSDHVGLEHYEWVKSGRMQPGELLRLIHRHVLAGCEKCRREWDELVEGEHADLWELLIGEPGELPFDVPLSPTTGQPERPAPYASAFAAADRQITDAETALKRDRTRARKELAALLELPAGERLTAIRRARRRFRSPAFAHLLVEDARTRVRRSPREALEVLDLVRPALELIPGALAREWARALAVRAEAHRANALRVTGDLHAADRHFREVRHRLAAAGIEDAAVEAEVASLEASLRRDQRRYEEAALLLDRAAVIYETVRENEGLARVLIQRAEIGQHFERHEDALADLERARTLLDPERQPFLYLFTVVGAVPTLLDGGRYLEAERVLGQAEGTVAAAEPWWRLRFHTSRGGRRSASVTSIGRRRCSTTPARDSSPRSCPTTSPPPRSTWRWSSSTRGARLGCASWLERSRRCSRAAGWIERRWRPWRSSSGRCEPILRPSLLPPSSAATSRRRGTPRRGRRASTRRAEPRPASTGPSCLDVDTSPRSRALQGPRRRTRVGVVAAFPEETTNWRFPRHQVISPHSEFGYACGATAAESGQWRPRPSRRGRGWTMRRTKRSAGALLIAVLLLAGLAPAAAADSPLSADGWLGMLGQSLGTWWAAVTGDEAGRRGLTAASEVAPSLDPDGYDVAPSLDPNGNEVSPSLDPNGNEVSPSLDPNG